MRVIPKPVKKREAMAVESAKIAVSKAKKMKEGKRLLSAEEVKLQKLPGGTGSGEESTDVRYWQRWLQWR